MMGTLLGRALRKARQFVPVVALNGKVRFRGQVNPVLLERLLRAGGPS